MNSPDHEALVERLTKLMGELGGTGPALERMLQETAARASASTVQKLRPGPGDVVIVTLMGRIPAEVSELLQTELARHLGGARAVILDSGSTARLEREGRA